MKLGDVVRFFDKYFCLGKSFMERSKSNKMKFNKGIFIILYPTLLLYTLFVYRRIWIGIT